ncbi:zinc finger, C4 type [Dictyocaulus viviparus]|uniref:Zinc finger, C4 type n=1 Tax=Dictyocaulus viviparus TaxID=29172 RepID=A0A0D8XAX5_DICVI|nr:zinc finger, C4 type [Dictyocaulus viviparus]
MSISFGSMSEFLSDSSSEVDMTFIRSSEETVSDIQRTCKVCGDRANDYNFGVLTCESCKPFFRRNAVREEWRQSVIEYPNSMFQSSNMLQQTCSQLFQQCRREFTFLGRV